MLLSRLDKKLLEKIAERTGKEGKCTPAHVKYVREQISKRASKLGISSEAAQVLWAKELGIGTSHYQRSLSPHIQQQVRDLLPSVFSRRPETLEPKPSKKRSRALRQDVMIAAEIEYLLKDNKLRSRCSDLIKAKGNYDRVIREATTILDDRLRKLAGITDIKIDPSDLAVKTLHPNNPILKLSADKGEQEGFFFICKGLFQAFRNPTHHQLSDKFTRQDALRFCGFVDALLTVLEQAQKSP